MDITRDDFIKNLGLKLPSAPINYYRIERMQETIPLVGRKALISIKGYNGETAATYAVLLWSDKLDCAIMGPTYMSLDGEYRRYMLLPDQIEEIANSQEYGAAYDSIIDEFTQGNLIFHADLFGADESVEAEMANSRLPLTLFIISWMMFGEDIRNHHMEAHANASFINLFAMTPAPPKLDVELKYGAKIIPLPNGIQQNEIILSKRATELVIMGIAYGLPITLYPIFVPGAHAGLFDNFVSHKKYQVSEAVKLLHKRKDTVKAVRPDVLAIRKSVILSPSAVVLLTEDMGETLYDFLYSQDGKVAESILFDISYNLLCLHSKAGILHGDLHLRNCTVQLRDRAVIRLLEDTYVLPAGPRAGIIDFSRAVSWEETHRLEKITGFQMAEKLLQKDAEYNSDNGAKALYFKLTTIYDMIWFLKKLRDMLKPKHGKVDRIEEMLAWCKQKKSQLKESTYASENEFEWPMQDFIDAMFAGLKGAIPRDGSQSEWYNYNKQDIIDNAPEVVEGGAAEIEAWMLW